MKAEKLMIKTAVLLSLAGIVVLLLNGCLPTPSTTSTPAIVPAQSTTIAPSATPSPAATATPGAPSATVTPTQIPSDTPTLLPTPSPTPLPGLDHAKVTQIHNQVGGVEVVVSVPNLSTDYNIILAGIKYTCSIDAKYPNDLFCYGLAQPPFNKTVNLTFLNPATGQDVLEIKTYLAEADFPPPGKETNNSTNCTQKGQNQSCEIECRLDPNGNPCIVASCFDACGQTISIQTCDSNLNNISNCSAEQLQDIKKRYNLP